MGILTNSNSTSKSRTADNVNCRRQLRSCNYSHAANIWTHIISRVLYSLKDSRLKFFAGYGWTTIFDPAKNLRMYYDLWVWPFVRAHAQRPLITYHMRTSAHRLQIWALALAHSTCSYRHQHARSIACIIMIRAYTIVLCARSVLVVWWVWFYGPRARA